MENKQRKTADILWLFSPSLPVNPCLVSASFLGSTSYQATLVADSWEGAGSKF
jgi:hypothetical protein